LGTDTGLVRGERARIGRQIVLPFSKAFEIAWKGIRIRLWRSLITMSGIILAIAFLMSVWTSGAVNHALVSVTEDDPKYPLVQRALQEHAIAMESLVISVGVIGTERGRADTQGIPRHVDIRRYLQPLQECEPFVVPNDLKAFKVRMSGEEMAKPDALVLTGIPSELANGEAVGIIQEFVRQGGMLVVFGGEGLLPEGTDAQTRQSFTTLLPARLGQGTFVASGEELQPAGHRSVAEANWKEHPRASFVKTEGAPQAEALAGTEEGQVAWMRSYGEGEVIWYPVAESPNAEESLNWFLEEGFLVNALRWGAREKIQGGTMAKRNLWLVTLSLLVCVVGITNAMLMSVTERFREIGTMKCLGALDKFVVKLFLIESSLQGIFGSLVGVVLGFSLSFFLAALTFRVTDPASGHTYWLAFSYLPLGTLLLWGVVAVAVGAALSVIAGVYPARKAAKMEPVEAMRIEM